MKQYLTLLFVIISSFLVAIEPQGSNKYPTTTWLTPHNTIGTVLSTSSLKDWGRGYKSFTVVGSSISVNAGSNGATSKYFDYGSGVNNTSYLDALTWDYSQPMTAFVVFSPSAPQAWPLASDCPVIISASNSSIVSGWLGYAGVNGNIAFYQLSEFSWCRPQTDLVVTYDMNVYHEFGINKPMSIAVSWSGSGKLGQLWANGRFIGQNQCNGSNGTCGRGDCFRIGGDLYNYTGYASIKLYHVVVFNKVLSNAEVTQLDEQLRKPLLNK